MAVRCGRIYRRISTSGCGKESLVTANALTRAWPQSPLQGEMTCGKTNKTKNNNACLMKCENCFFAFANHRHDNGKF